MLTIRRFQTGDENALSALIRRTLREVNYTSPKSELDYLIPHYSPETMVELSRTGHTYVLEEDGQIVGSGTVLPDGETEAEKIADPHELELGVFHLAGATLLLALSSYLHLEMVWAALGFALSLAVLTVLLFLHRHARPTVLFSAVRRLPFELIPFVLSMFVLVLGMNYSGLTERLAAVLVTDRPILSVGISSFFAANLINNIPMSVLFSSVLETVTDPEVYRQGVFAAVVGSNIGAYLTPVGALAGIMWSSILRRFGIRFSFRRFLLYGAAVAIPTLFAALAGLWIVLG